MMTFLIGIITSNVCSLQIFDFIDVIFYVKNEFYLQNFIRWDSFSYLNDLRKKTIIRNLIVYYITVIEVIFTLIEII